MRSAQAQRSRNYGYELRVGERCLYCGGVYEVDDHAWPAAGDITLAPEEMRVRVAARIECNAIAHGELFASIEEKRAYIRGHLVRKYRKLLDTPEWSAEELGELAPSLRRIIKGYILAAEDIKERITWMQNL